MVAPRETAFIARAKPCLRAKPPVSSFLRHRRRLVVSSAAFGYGTAESHKRAPTERALVRVGPSPTLRLRGWAARDGMYATNVAVARSTSVTTAELISPRTTCQTVADAITIMMRPAAQTTSPGAILVSPVSGSPTPASTSATPRKGWNPARQGRVHLHGDLRGGARKSQP